MVATVAIDTAAYVVSSVLYGVIVPEENEQLPTELTSITVIASGATVDVLGNTTYDLNTGKFSIDGRDPDTQYTVNISVPAGVLAPIQMYTAPADPTDVVVYRSDGKLRVSWTQISGLTYGANISDGNLGENKLNVTSPVEFTGLTNESGNTVQIVVKRSRSGTLYTNTYNVPGIWTPTASILTMGDVTATPMSQAVRLSWAAVSGADHYIVTTERVSSGGGGGEVGVGTITGSSGSSGVPPAPITVTGSGSSVDVTGLVNGLEYRFSVVAYPSVNASIGYSAPVVQTATPNVALIMGNVVATPFSNNSLHLRWASVDNASSYTIDELDGKCAPVTINDVEEYGQHSHIINGLNASDTYRFAVTATSTLNYSSRTSPPVDATMNGAMLSTAENTRTFRRQLSATTVSVGFTSDGVSSIILNGDVTYMLWKYNATSGIFEYVNPTFRPNGAYIRYSGLSPNTEYELLAVFSDRLPVVRRLRTVATTIYPVPSKGDVTLSTVEPQEDGSALAKFTISPTLVAQRNSSPTFDNMRFWRVQVRWYTGTTFVSSYWTHAHSSGNIKTQVLIPAGDITPGTYTFRVRMGNPDDVYGAESQVFTKTVDVGIPKITDITGSGETYTAVTSGLATSYVWQSSIDSGATYTAAGANSSFLTQTFSTGTVLRVTPYNGSVVGTRGTYVVGGLTQGVSVSLLSTSQIQAAAGSMTNTEKLSSANNLSVPQLQTVDTSVMTASQVAALLPQTVATMTPAQIAAMTPTAKAAIISAAIQALTVGAMSELLKEPSSLTSEQLAAMPKEKVSSASSTFTAQEKAAAALAMQAAAGLAMQDANTAPDTSFEKAKNLQKNATTINPNVKSLLFSTTGAQLGTAALIGTVIANMAAAGGKMTVPPGQVGYSTAGPGESSSFTTGAGTATVGLTADGKAVINGTVITKPSEIVSTPAGPLAAAAAKSVVSGVVNAPFIEAGVSNQQISLTITLNQSMNMTDARVRIMRNGAQLSEHMITDVDTADDLISYNDTTASAGTAYSYTAQIVGSNDGLGLLSAATQALTLPSINSTPPSVTATGGAGQIEVSASLLSAFSVDVIKVDGTLFGTYTSMASSLTIPSVPADRYHVRTYGVNNIASVTTVTVFSGGGSGGAVCFLGDAPVLTARGYRPIREFRVGDSVMTADGREVAISRVFSRRYGPSAAVNPYVIPKGFLGATRPVAISPDHEVLVPGRGMVRARDMGLRRMKMGEDFVYYNLELEDWTRDNLVIAGVTCESLAPATRMTMSTAEFVAFVTSRYGSDAAARLRLQSVCFKETDGRVSMPAFR